MENKVKVSYRNVREQYIHFLWRQINDISKGGLPVFLRKVCTLLLLLAVLVIRAIRPLVLVRFKCLISERIGHFASDTEVYLCERDAGLFSPRTIDILYSGPQACNYQLKKMWDRKLRFSRLAIRLDELNRQLRGAEKHIVPFRIDQNRDIYGLLQRTQPHLSFTTEEESLGYISLQNLGIYNGVPFVCFHSRSSDYLDKMFPNKNWRYHDYRDSSIKNLIPAAEELARRGYFAVRMGAVVKEPLEITNPMIVDYATKARGDFLDIFLGAKCHFYLGDPCGFSAIPLIFRRPWAIVNMVPLEYVPSWGPKDIFIPKKLWIRKEGRFMTFREILDSGVGRFYESQQYERLGLEVVENTAEEISALAIEMDERLKGIWKTSQEDEELQRRFWSLFKPSELHGVFLSHISRDFLRENLNLLD